MATEIRVRFDGDTPGLGDGRLSLGQFLPAMEELLGALRRIGSNIVVEAADDTERGLKGGRLAKEAEVLDLEISGISHNCLVIEMIPTAHPRVGESPLLFNDLPERAGLELLESIEAESAGRPRNSRVRKYLEKIPRGVTGQVYSLAVSGRERKRVEVKGAAKIERGPVLPGLREFVATPVGVVFAEGRGQVRLSPTEGAASWYLASDGHVNLVMENRNARVRVLVAYHEPGLPRVLRMRLGDAPLEPATPAAVHRRIFEDWKGVLRKLS